jgi:hypothetical protein
VQGAVVGRARPIVERRQRARRRTVQRLDVDDLGAMVGEQFAAVSRRDGTADVEYANAGKRLCCHGIPPDRSVGS